MKIAVTATGKELSANIDPRFGRASQFLIIDSDTDSLDVVENKQILDLPQGAGIQAAQNLVSHHVDVLITGNCGPKAFRVLEAAGIRLIIGAKGRIDKIIDEYKDGALEYANSANVEGHWV
jgi:predicted Fe-Mo cluster-binding NifX family protein